MKHYIYLGDKLTDPSLKGKTCTALEQPNGKCIRGKNGTMLVVFESGRKANIIGRLLRKCAASNPAKFPLPNISL